MEKIRPISDLRNKFTEISQLVNEENEVIFFTKNGYGNMVVMSMNRYEKLIASEYIDDRLETSLVDLKKGNMQYHDDVFRTLKTMINEKKRLRYYI